MADSHLCRRALRAPRRYEVRRVRNAHAARRDARGTDRVHVRNERERRVAKGNGQAQPARLRRRPRRMERHLGRRERSAGPVRAAAHEELVLHQDKSRQARQGRSKKIFSRRRRGAEIRKEENLLPSYLCVSASLREYFVLFLLLPWRAWRAWQAIFLSAATLE